MDVAYRQALAHSGAVIEDDAATPAHFGDPNEELRSAVDAVVLSDRSELGRLLAGGPDFLDLLHRLSTGDVKSLAPGDGRPTVLTSPKGRIVERLFVHHLGARGVLAVCGLGNGEKVLEHMRRYTFAEDTGLRDVTLDSCQLALTGPAAAETMRAAGLPAPPAQHAAVGHLEGVELDVVAEDGLSEDGFSLVAPANGAAVLWEALLPRIVAAGGRPAGQQALEAYRVLRGLPASGSELTEAYNPLEAGQWDAVSFEKGCYVGQEVVARLRTYDKVARALVGLELPGGSALPAAGTKLYREGREVGRLTSAVVLPGGGRTVALGYVKRREIEPGAELRLADSGSGCVVRVSDLPFRF